VVVVDFVVSTFAVTNRDLSGPRLPDPCHEAGQMDERGECDPIGQTPYVATHGIE
jgi:hypothetical protein